MFDQVRQEITALVHPSFGDAHPGVRMVTENEPFDWDAPPGLFVEFEVEFLHGAQIGMSAHPSTRVSGFVYVTVKARQGTGSAEANQILWWFAQALQFKTTALTRLGEVKPDGASKTSGWYMPGIKVPFYADPA